MNASPPVALPSLARIKKQIGPQVAHLPDDEVVKVYRYAQAVAGLKADLIFYDAGIPPRTAH